MVATVLHPADLQPEVIHLYKEWVLRRSLPLETSAGASEQELWVLWGRVALCGPLFPAAC